MAVRRTQYRDGGDEAAEDAVGPGEVSGRDRDRESETAGTESCTVYVLCCTERDTVGLHCRSTDESKYNCWKTKTNIGNGGRLFMLSMLMRSCLHVSRVSPLSGQLKKMPNVTLTSTSCPKPSLHPQLVPGPAAHPLGPNNGSHLSLSD